MIENACEKLKNGQMSRKMYKMVSKLPDFLKFAFICLPVAVAWDDFGGFVPKST